jgi:hypothetical protein
MWNSLSSNFKISLSLNNFLTSVVRTNFGFTRKNNILNLTIQISPPIRPLLWVADTLYQMIEYSGKVNVVKNLTPDLRKDSIKPLIRKAVLGPFLYVMTEFKRNSLDGSIEDVESNREVLKKLHTNSSLKFLTGTIKTINLFGSKPVFLDLKIPSIFGTGNVKNKSDNFVGRLIINVKPYCYTDDWFVTINEWDSKIASEFFNTEHYPAVTFNKLQLPLYFINNLFNSNVFSQFGKLELSKFTLEENTIEKNPLLSYFSVENLKTKEVFEYTIQSNPSINVYSIAICQIFGSFPLGLTSFGCNSKDIDVNYLDSKDNNLSSSDFVNDILTKFYFVNKFTPSSTKVNSGDTHKLEEGDHDQHVFNRLTSNTKSVVVYLYTGLSMDGDLTSLFPGLGPSGPKKGKPSNKPNNPDSNDSGGGSGSSSDTGKPSGPSGPNDNSENPDSENVEVSNPDLLVNDNLESYPLDVSNELDLLENPGETTSKNKVFNLFRRVGSTSLNVAKIVAPNIGTALDLSYKTYSALSKKSKPEITINTNNNSLIQSLNLHNNFSVVPSLGFKKFSGRK